ncbi:MAG TPA: hypothetical protein VFM43_07145 [Gaiellaceae bacterium]|nr:hypothetical protein [Gaiellaceae bacterium]
MLAVAAGVVLGAVFGQPSSGRAASSAVPTNKTLPTITGTLEQGFPLTATHGSWTGSPTSFRYAWSRCDAGGNGCVAIPSATAKVYTLSETDVGHTIRVTVTARNASGVGRATSAPTGVVSLGGCPPGTGGIPIADLAPPARLQIASASVSPAPTLSSRTIRIRIGITACNGRPVQGATVYATTVPFNQFTPGSETTDSTGAVTIKQPRLRGFPARSRGQRLLAVFVRATKPGEPVLAGVSTRRVFAFRIAR